VTTTPAHAAAPSLEQLIAQRPAEEQGPVRDFFAAHPPGAGAPVAVVIPAYNEEPTVAAVVRAIPAELAGQPAEVIVVVDGSTDQTAARASDAGALVCDVRVNRGQGTVYWLGYWLARQRGAKVIGTIDADGQYEESELGLLVEPILSGRADVVYGSRRLGTELTTDPVRHAGLLLFGGLVSILIRQKITDPAAGLRAFRVDVPETITLEQPQYQSSELLISSALHGFRVIEVGTTMKDRPVGATGTKKGPNLLYGMRFARAVLGTWRRDRKAARTRLRSENTQ
jgi:hypothetical protein